MFKQHSRRCLYEVEADDTSSNEYNVREGDKRSSHQETGDKKKPCCGKCPTNNTMYAPLLFKFYFC